MAEKKATYKVKTDAGYDEIYLKTTAEQVKTKENKTVQQFFDEGGTIKGNLVVSGGSLAVTKDITTTQGNITVNEGDITVTKGDVKGVNVTANGTVSTKDISATGNAAITGDISGKGISATEDITTKKSFRATENIVTETGIVKGKTLQVTEHADITGDINAKGLYQTDSKIMKLFEGSKAIDGTGEAMRFKYDNSNYLAISKKGEFTIYSSETTSGNKHIRIFSDSETHTQIRNADTVLKLLNKGAAEVQAMSAKGGYCAVNASQYKTTSSQKYKTNIKEYSNNATDILKANNVKEYNLISDVELATEGVITQDQVSDKLGFILEELTDEAKRLFSPKGSDGVDTYCIVSMLWKVCQEQQARIEQLEAKMLNA